jgi:hypothetical protein
VVGGAAADLKLPEGGRQPKRQPTSDAAEKASKSCLQTVAGSGRYKKVGMWKERKMVRDWERVRKIAGAIERERERERAGEG